jgi:hypothetical protein
MARFFSKIGEPRFGFVVEHDPSGVASDRDHARPADFTHRVANDTETVMIERTVVVAEPFARANVLATLGGRGAPAGVVRCAERGETVVVTFDADRSSPALIDALVAIACRFVPAATAPSDDPAVRAGIAARGLNEPELDVTRILETYLP